MTIVALEQLAVFVIILLLLAILVEELVEALKRGFPIIVKLNEEVEWAKILVILPVCIGVLFCYGAAIDVFIALGVTFSIPYVGFIIPGVIIGRGSNGVYDWFRKSKEAITMVDKPSALCKCWVDNPAHT